MNQKPQINPKASLKQLNFKVQPDFYWKLKNFASSKRLLMAELFEKSFEFYQQREVIVNDKIKTYQQTIQAIENQMKPFLGSMSWLELESRLKNLTSAYFDKAGLTIAYQVLKDSLSECLRLEKERNRKI